MRSRRTQVREGALQSRTAAFLVMVVLPSAPLRDGGSRQRHGFDPRVYSCPNTARNLTATCR